MLIHRLAAIALPACALLLSLFPLYVIAIPCPDIQQQHGRTFCLWTSDWSGGALRKRDGGSMHMHHGQPEMEINETEILQWHLPTPPSYWSIDVENPDPDVPRYPGLMILHVVFMSLAFFVALPAGIALRSVKHPWHPFSLVCFYVLCTFGCAASILYRNLTPDMYEGSVHFTQGYFVIFLSVILSVMGVAAFCRRLYTQVRAEPRCSLKTIYYTVVLGRQETQEPSFGYTEIASEDPGQYDVLKSMLPSSQESSYSQGDRPTINVQTRGLGDSPSQHEAPQPGLHFSTDSTSSSSTVFWGDSPKDSRHSDETLHDEAVASAPYVLKALRCTAVAAFATLERVLVFAAFGMTLSGIVTYTGGCRDSYINGCLAHLIKGGIFWCYGLFTFARFLGSFSEMGWAWNISPIGNTYSAEFVESTVIFLYGISNTWMERFGAHPGDPYTTKQVQHISIAVMFWFAGLVGMGMESKRIRDWLAATAASPSGHIQEPPSYRASFNPFPALVIGVTGAAMSAHAQAYVFQVQIHQLWGWLLLGFSVLRCLTYFFLWINPPKSILPSRPPTEALGSFFLACGGLMFMLSTEEVTLAAMRRGRDDMMMFLNVAVAFTCFAFCWVLCVVAFNGWLKHRLNPRITSASS